VDAEDFPRVGQTTWTTAKCGGSLYDRSKPGDVFLHRFIMEPVPPGRVIHHRSGETRDNRKRNLVTLTKSEHNATMSGRMGYASAYKRVHLAVA
jgi:hypothetical protein